MIKTAVIAATVTIAAVATLVAGVGAAWKFDVLPALPPPVTTHQSRGLRIEQVQQLASLVVLEVPISDIQVTTRKGYTGGMSVILLVRGDAQIATDLDKAEFTTMDSDAKIATLMLDPPQVRRPRLDHEGTKIFQVDRSGLWNAYPGAAGEGDLIDEAMARAQRLVGEVAIDPALMVQARRRAELVLTQFFAAMEWTVTVTWRDQAEPTTTKGSAAPPPSASSGTAASSSSYPGSEAGSASAHGGG